MKYFILIIAIFLTACGGVEQKQPEGKEEHAHAAEEGNTATLTEEQMKSIGIELGSIEKKQLTASLRANGVLKVPNQNKASINSVYNGVIKTLLVQTGSPVTKGQVIATISNPQFIQVQEEYMGINAKIRHAEQEYNRQKELNEGNAGALKNLQAAETELRTVQARRAGLKQQIELMGINPSSLVNGKLFSVVSLRSPINGVVSQVSVNLGSYVDVSTLVAEIVDNSQLHLDLFVYEKDLPKLKKDQVIHFTLTNNPGREYDAEIFSLGSSFEGESKAVSVHAMVKGNKSGLIDGMGITALISLEKAVVPAVPTDALISAQGQDYIFIVRGKDDHGLDFERIPVAKGTTDVGYTEITPLKDIPADAKVVVKGAFFILAKQTNSGEHAH
jgi:cobalt-zinc-cadmium efflux system membrane fusion protein